MGTQVCISHHTRLFSPDDALNALNVLCRFYMKERKLRTHGIQKYYTLKELKVYLEPSTPSL
jgi:hypothetical protein